MEASRRHLIGRLFIALGIAGFFIAGGLFVSPTDVSPIFDWIGAFFFGGGWALMLLIGSYLVITANKGRRP